MEADRPDDILDKANIPPHKAIYLESQLRSIDTEQSIEVLREALKCLLRLMYAKEAVVDKMLRQFGT